MGGMHTSTPCPSIPSFPTCTYHSAPTCPSSSSTRLSRCTHCFSTAPWHGWYPFPKTLPTHSSLPAHTTLHPPVLPAPQRASPGARTASAQRHGMGGTPSPKPRPPIPPYLHIPLCTHLSFQLLNAPLKVHALLQHSAMAWVVPLPQNPAHPFLPTCTYHSAPTCPSSSSTRLSRCTHCFSTAPWHGWYPFPKTPPTHSSLPAHTTLHPPVLPAPQRASQGARTASAQRHGMGGTPSPKPRPPIPPYLHIPLCTHLSFQLLNAPLQVHALLQHSAMAWVVPLPQNPAHPFLPTCTYHSAPTCPSSSSTRLSRCTHCFSTAPWHGWYPFPKTPPTHSSLPAHTTLHPPVLPAPQRASPGARTASAQRHGMGGTPSPKPRPPIPPYLHIPLCTHLSFQLLNAPLQVHALLQHSAMAWVVPLPQNPAHPFLPTCTYHSAPTCPSSSSTRLSRCTHCFSTAPWHGWYPFPKTPPTHSSLPAHTTLHPPVLPAPQRASPGARTASAQRHGMGGTPSPKPCPPIPPYLHIPLCTHLSFQLLNAPLQVHALLQHSAMAWVVPLPQNPAHPFLPTCTYHSAPTCPSSSSTRLSRCTHCFSTAPWHGWYPFPKTPPTHSSLPAHTTLHPPVLPAPQRASPGARTASAQRHGMGGTPSPKPRPPIPPYLHIPLCTHLSFQLLNAPLKVHALLQHSAMAWVVPLPQNPAHPFLPTCTYHSAPTCPSSSSTRLSRCTHCFSTAPWHGWYPFPKTPPTHSSLPAHTTLHPPVLPAPQRASQGARTASAQRHGMGGTPSPKPRPPIPPYLHIPLCTHLSFQLLNAPLQVHALLQHSAMAWVVPLPQNPAHPFLPTCTYHSAPTCPSSSSTRLSRCTHCFSTAPWHGWYPFPKTPPTHSSLPAHTTLHPPVLPAPQRASPGARTASAQRHGMGGTPSPKPRPPIPPYLHIPLCTHLSFQLLNAPLQVHALLQHSAMAWVVPLPQNPAHPFLPTCTYHSAPTCPSSSSTRLSRCTHCFSTAPWHGWYPFPKTPPTHSSLPAHTTLHPPVLPAPQRASPGARTASAQRHGMGGTPSPKPRPPIPPYLHIPLCTHLSFQLLNAPLQVHALLQHSAMAWVVPLPQNPAHPFLPTCTYHSAPTCPSSSSTRLSRCTHCFSTAPWHGWYPFPKTPPTHSSLPAHTTLHPPVLPAPQRASPGARTASAQRHGMGGTPSLKPRPPIPPYLHIPLCTHLSFQLLNAPLQVHALLQHSAMAWVVPLPQNPAHPFLPTCTYHSAPTCPSSSSTRLSRCTHCFSTAPWHGWYPFPKTPPTHSSLPAHTTLHPPVLPAPQRASPGARTASAQRHGMGGTPSPKPRPPIPPYLHIPLCTHLSFQLLNAPLQVHALLQHSAMAWVVPLPQNPAHPFLPTCTYHSAPTCPSSSSTRLSRCTHCFSTAPWHGWYPFPKTPPTHSSLPAHTTLHPPVLPAPQRASPGARTASAQRHGMGGTPSPKPRPPIPPYLHIPLCTHLSFQLLNAPLQVHALLQHSAMAWVVPLPQNPAHPFLPTCTYHSAPTCPSSSSTRLSRCTHCFSTAPWHGWYPFPKTPPTHSSLPAHTTLHPPVLPAPQRASPGARTASAQRHGMGGTPSPKPRPPIPPYLHIPLCTHLSFQLLNAPLKVHALLQHSAMAWVVPLPQNPAHPFLPTCTYHSAPTCPSSSSTRLSRCTHCFSTAPWHGWYPFPKTPPTHSSLPAHTTLHPPVLPAPQRASPGARTASAQRHGMGGTPSPKPRPPIPPYLHIPLCTHLSFQLLNAPLQVHALLQHSAMAWVVPLPQNPAHPFLPTCTYHSAPTCPSSSSTRLSRCTHCFSTAPWHGWYPFPKTPPTHSSLPAHTTLHPPVLPAPQRASQGARTASAQRHGMGGTPSPKPRPPIPPYLHIPLCTHLSFQLLNAPLKVHALLQHSAMAWVVPLPQNPAHPFLPTCTYHSAPTCPSSSSTRLSRCTHCFSTAPWHGWYPFPKTPPTHSSLPAHTTLHPPVLPAPQRASQGARTASAQRHGMGGTPSPKPRPPIPPYLHIPLCTHLSFQLLNAPLQVHALLQHSAMAWVVPLPQNPAHPFLPTCTYHSAPTCPSSSSTRLSRCTHCFSTAPWHGWYPFPKTPPTHSSLPAHTTLHPPVLPAPQRASQGARTASAQRHGMGGTPSPKPRPPIPPYLHIPLCTHLSFQLLNAPLKVHALLQHSAMAWVVPLPQNPAHPFLPTCTYHSAPTCPSSSSTRLSRCTHCFSTAPWHGWYPFPKTPPTHSSLPAHTTLHPPVLPAPQRASQGARTASAQRHGMGGTPSPKPRPPIPPYLHIPLCTHLSFQLLNAPLKVHALLQHSAMAWVVPLPQNPAHPFLPTCTYHSAPTCPSSSSTRLSRCTHCFSTAPWHGWYPFPKTPPTHSSLPAHTTLHPPVLPAPQRASQGARTASAQRHGMGGTPSPKPRPPIPPYLHIPLCTHLSFQLLNAPLKVHALLQHSAMAWVVPLPQNPAHPFLPTCTYHSAPTCPSSSSTRLSRCTHCFSTAPWHGWYPFPKTPPTHSSLPAHTTLHPPVLPAPQRASQGARTASAQRHGMGGTPSPKPRPPIPPYLHIPLCTHLSFQLLNAPLKVHALLQHSAMAWVVPLPQNPAHPFLPTCTYHSAPTCPSSSSTRLSRCTHCFSTAPWHGWYPFPKTPPTHSSLPAHTTLHPPVLPAPQRASPGARTASAQRHGMGGTPSPKPRPPIPPYLHIPLCTHLSFQLLNAPLKVHALLQHSAMAWVVPLPQNPAHPFLPTCTYHSAPTCPSSSSTRLSRCTHCFSTAPWHGWYPFPKTPPTHSSLPAHTTLHPPVLPAPQRASEGARTASAQRHGMGGTPSPKPRPPIPPYLHIPLCTHLSFQLLNAPLQVHALLQHSAMAWVVPLPQNPAHPFLPTCTYHSAPTCPSSSSTRLSRCTHCFSTAPWHGWYPFPKTPPTHSSLPAHTTLHPPVLPAPQRASPGARTASAQRHGMGGTPSPKPRPPIPPYLHIPLCTHLSFQLLNAPLQVHALLQHSAMAWVVPLPQNPAHPFLPTCTYHSAPTCPSSSSTRLSRCTHCFSTAPWHGWYPFPKTPPTHSSLPAHTTLHPPVLPAPQRASPGARTASAQRHGMGGTPSPKPRPPIPPYLHIPLCTHLSFQLLNAPLQVHALLQHSAMAWVVPLPQNPAHPFLPTCTYHSAPTCPSSSSTRLSRCTHCFSTAPWHGWYPFPKTPPTHSSLPAHTTLHPPVLPAPQRASQGARTASAQRHGMGGTPSPKPRPPIPPYLHIPLCTHLSFQLLNAPLKVHALLQHSAMAWVVPLPQNPAHPFLPTCTYHSAPTCPSSSSTCLSRCTHCFSTAPWHGWYPFPKTPPTHSSLPAHTTLHPPVLPAPQRASQGARTASAQRHGMGGTPSPKPRPPIPPYLHIPLCTHLSFQLLNAPLKVHALLQHSAMAWVVPLPQNPAHPFLPTCTYHSAPTCPSSSSTRLSRCTHCFSTAPWHGWYPFPKTPPTHSSLPAHTTLHPPVLPAPQRASQGARTASAQRHGMGGTPSPKPRPPIPPYLHIPLCTHLSFQLLNVPLQVHALLQHSAMAWVVPLPQNPAHPFLPTCTYHSAPTCPSSSSTRLSRCTHCFSTAPWHGWYPFPKTPPTHSSLPAHTTLHPPVLPAPQRASQGARTASAQRHGMGGTPSPKPRPPIPPYLHIPLCTHLSFQLLNAPLK
ncbi:unnamed protein product, partial [Closterium sp. Naga37s-1]